ncbi:MAG TPA: hypothetical protein VFA33_01175 [Bryobacteraceae bacterium]|nr:hypothetical protein [Bryobacteraceae bacterium]
MSTGPVSNLSSSYLQSIVTGALGGAGLSTNNSLGSIDPASVAPSDKRHLSPFAQMMSELQQLQQSAPAKYQQVTQQIATNLQNAAQTAQAQGNTTAVNQLNQLAGDFTSASKSGQLPNVQDLAQAVGGHHHGHHHHALAASTDPYNDSTSGSSSASSANQTLSQLLAAFQTSSNQSDALDPTFIIMNTLSSAGITGVES